MRVPDDVRAAFGKLEVHKSLKTGDHAEAKQRARYERLNLDAEWGRLRRLREIEHRDELDDREIEYLARRWFVAEEKKGQGVALSREDLREAEIDLTHMMEWEEIGGSVTTALDKLLNEEGIELAHDSLSRRRLEQWVHSGMIEGQRRLLVRNHALLPFALDPEFAGLSSATRVNPVAKFTLADLIEQIGSDKSRRPVSPKSRFKREAHFRVFRGFFRGRQAPCRYQPWARAPLLQFARHGAR